MNGDDQNRPLLYTINWNSKQLIDRLIDFLSFTQKTNLWSLIKIEKLCKCETGHYIFRCAIHGRLWSSSFICKYTVDLLKIENWKLVTVNEFMNVITTFFYYWTICEEATNLYVMIYSICVLDFWIYNRVFENTSF